MSELLFNHGGRTHSLRLRPVDVKPDETDVYEAMIDLNLYVHFEAPHDAEVWELFELAISAYREYLRDCDVIRVDHANERRH